MSTTHKPFRELLRTDSNFEFVGRTRLWVIVSIFLVGASIAMLFVNNAWRGDYLNWTIDFKGGTEMIFGFRDKATNEHTSVNAGEVRKALAGADQGDFEVSDFSWSEVAPDGESKTVKGMLVRTPGFGGVSEDVGDKIIEAFNAELADRGLQSVRWSGDRLFVRSKQPLDEAAAKQLLARFELEMKDWGDNAQAYRTPDQSTGEYEAQLSIFGLERQYAKTLSEDLGVDVELIQAYAVGARAGKELRNDGIKAIFYAMALIMLYLAFRFDVRYAPGAVIALLHDSLLVVGVFAVTWTEVSLTSVAALLTVIGYSVNDTVIIFDRIRENVGRLKDKKLARVINISLNETLSRTLLTSTTLFVVTVAMNVFSTGLVRNFAFAMNIGVIAGVYSSVFIAAPVMLWIDTKYYSGRATPKQ